MKKKQTTKDVERGKQGTGFIVSWWSESKLMPKKWQLIFLVFSVLQWKELYCNIYY